MLDSSRSQLWMIKAFSLSRIGDLIIFLSCFENTFHFLWRKPTNHEEILTIDIKPGWKKGTKITFPKKGNEARNVTPSDLVFIIEERAHPRFRRDGNDLICTHKISLVEALTGCTVQVVTLDERTLNIPVKSIVSPTYEEVVQGEGMPITREPSRKGNLRIKFQIKFPTSLTGDQKAAIQQLLSWSSLYNVSLLGVFVCVVVVVTLAEWTVYFFRASIGVFFSSYCAKIAPIC